MVQAMRNVGAGLVTSLLSLATTFSYGALIFAGPLQPFLGQGLAAALITPGGYLHIRRFDQHLPLSRCWTQRQHGRSLGGHDG